MDVRDRVRAPFGEFGRTLELNDVSMEPNAVNIIFLGGIFRPRDIVDIKACSDGVMQYAADSLQRKYLKGFVESPEVSRVVFVNLPFIGAYRKRYSRIRFIPKDNVESLARCTFINQSFLNVAGIKHIARFVQSYRGLMDAIRKLGSERRRTVVLCYSMHLPFLAAVVLVKARHPSVLFGVIAPDLPEFMASRHGLQRAVYGAMAKVSYGLVKYMDFTVAITASMIERLKKPGVVVEGIAGAGFETPPTVEPALGSMEVETPVSEVIRGLGRYVLYTGTLDPRYGIAELVDAFCKLRNPVYRLVVCGAGAAQAYVASRAFQSPKLSYLGQVDPAFVLDLQKQAALLVNPRRNTGEFTKFSFPSKILEYMDSGNAVLMFRLDGIPDEYYRYCYLVEEYGGDLGSALEATMNIDRAKRRALGAAARAFVRREKCAERQVEKVMQLIEKNVNPEIQKKISGVGHG